MEDWFFSLCFLSGEKKTRWREAFKDGDRTKNEVVGGRGRGKVKKGESRVEESSCLLFLSIKEETTTKKSSCPETDSWVYAALSRPGLFSSVRLSTSTESGRSLHSSGFSLQHLFHSTLMAFSLWRPFYQHSELTECMHSIFPSQFPNCWTKKVLP